MTEYILTMKGVQTANIAARFDSKLRIDMGLTNVKTYASGKTYIVTDNELNMEKIESLAQFMRLEVLEVDSHPYVPKKKGFFEKLLDKLKGKK